MCVIWCVTTPPPPTHTHSCPLKNNESLPATVLNCSFLRQIFLWLCCVRWCIKYNKNFIQDFANFVAGTTLKYDHFLNIGDINIYLGCESKPLAKDFLSLTNSFNLTQSVSGPTHEKGHTLDLVLSYGFCITISELCDMYFRSPACFIYCGCSQFGDLIAFNCPPVWRFNCL